MNLLAMAVGLFGPEPAYQVISYDLEFGLVKLL